MNFISPSPIERARYVRDLADALVEALDHHPDDVTHFEVRGVLGVVLDRLGVVAMDGSGPARSWTFDDVTVEETSSPGRSFDSVDGASPEGDTVRDLREMAGRALLEDWRAVAADAMTALIRSGFEGGTFQVAGGVLHVRREGGALHAVFSPFDTAEVERLWGEAVVELRWPVAPRS